MLPSWGVILATVGSMASMTALPEEPADVGSGSLASRLQELVRFLATHDVAELTGLHDLGKAPQEWQALLDRIQIKPMGPVGPVGNLRSFGRAQKVSVSLPEGLTAVVQQRVGKGEFSHYVAEAVARQLELDLLAELAASLETEHGPIPEELLAEAGAAWPDVE
jgi:Arc/MetJ-type ribon-helix-helix transcriptional regulator